MYGKTLADFPERLDAFYLALADIPLMDLDYAFSECLRTCSEFPVPAEIRATVEAVKLDSRWRKHDAERELQKQRDNEIKQQRFQADDRLLALPGVQAADAERERLQKEFQDMVTAAKAKFPATTRQ